MSTEIDFKALWNREKTGAPDISEIFAKANRLNYCSRKKIWICNIVLTLTVALYIWIWCHYQPQFITTKIGMTMMIAAMVIFIIKSNQLIPLLAKADVETDTNVFLSQMIRIKHKQEFMDKTVLAIYFIMLAAGLGLYFIEYTSRANLVFKICAYAITLGLLAGNWFYISARNAKKQHKAISEIIAKLEEVNKQLSAPTP